MEDVETIPRKKTTHPVLLMVLAVVAAGAIAWALYLTLVQQPLQKNQSMNAELVYKTVGLAEGRPLRLDSRFTDSDGDLVADPPADPKQWIDPPRLSFSFVATEDPERYRPAFAELIKHIESITGKPTDYVSFKSLDEELNAMSNGRLQVAGLGTGSVPIAVNYCGFVPVCRMATADGVSTYQMEIIVPADSPIKTLDDLKGHELVLTDPGSNSGFKAPLVLLSKDNGLLPGRDFTIRYSGEQEHSIKGIATKQYQAAAVANDVLKRALAVGDIQKEQYRSIYKSENFPTAGFGYVYNLKPDLAAKVKAALLSFPWKGTGMEKEFEPGGQAKFVPVDFKNDWALVRRIDDAIRSIEKLENLATTMPTEAPKSPATRPQ